MYGEADVEEEFDIELVRGVNTKETDNGNVCRKPEEGENIFYPMQETNRHKLSKSRSYISTFNGSKFLASKSLAVKSFDDEISIVPN